MIETDKLIAEMLSIIGYASQTLKLHPEQVYQVEQYLKSEQVRLSHIIDAHHNNLDILERIVVY